MASKQFLQILVIVGFALILILQFSATVYATYLAYPPKPLPPCSDYEMLIININRCVSRCPIRCANGTCFEDGVCPCEGFYQTGYEIGLVCAAECLPGCRSAGGYCAAPDLCLCRKNYYFDAVARRCMKDSLFRDRCFGRCKYGTCTFNGQCICAQGFAYRNATIGQFCTPTCRQNCGHHGYCFLPNMCTCRKKHYHYEEDGQCHKDELYWR